VKRTLTLGFAVTLLLAAPAWAKGSKGDSKSEAPQEDAAKPQAEAKEPAAPPAAAMRKNSVAVMDTVAQNIPDAIAALTTQTLSSYATNSLGLDVIAKDDVKKLVSFEQLRQLAGCDSGNCSQAADLGAALGVEKILTSTIGKIGERISLSVVVMDVATGKVTGRGTRDLRSEDEIVENARDLAHFALKNEPRESKGYVRITVPVTGAQIGIDGSPYGVSPLPTPVRLLAGKHTIHIEATGYLPFDSAVEVEVGKEFPLEVKLIKKTDVKLAGAGYLPWAGATAGLAVVGTGISIFAYRKALNTCREWSLDSVRCSNGKDPKPATKSELDAAQKDVDLWGNKIAFFGAIGSGVLGATSIALFSAYFISGVGAAGDEPAADTPYRIEPTGDGFAIRF
jgi:hypothetical protein